MKGTERFVGFKEPCLCRSVGIQIYSKSWKGGGNQKSKGEDPEEGTATKRKIGGSFYGGTNRGPLQTHEQTPFGGGQGTGQGSLALTTMKREEARGGAIVPTKVLGQSTRLRGGTKPI